MPAAKAERARRRHDAHELFLTVDTTRFSWRRFSGRIIDAATTLSSIPKMIRTCRGQPTPRH